jgi:hypothetical protein
MFFAPLDFVQHPLKFRAPNRHLKNNSHTSASLEFFSLESFFQLSTRFRAEVKTAARTKGDLLKKCLPTPRTNHLRLLRLRWLLRMRIAISGRKLCRDPVHSLKNSVGQRATKALSGRFQTLAKVLKFLHEFIKFLILVRCHIMVSSR